MLLKKTNLKRKSFSVCANRTNVNHRKTRLSNDLVDIIMTISQFLLSLKPFDFLSRKGMFFLIRRDIQVEPHQSIESKSFFRSSRKREKKLFDRTFRYFSDKSRS